MEIRKDQAVHHDQILVLFSPTYFSVYVELRNVCVIDNSASESRVLVYI